MVSSNTMFIGGSRLVPELKEVKKTKLVRTFSVFPFQSMEAGLNMLTIHTQNKATNLYFSIL